MNNFKFGTILYSDFLFCFCCCFSDFSNFKIGTNLNLDYFQYYYTCYIISIPISKKVVKVIKTSREF